jgi:hypothetical protein
MRMTSIVAQIPMLIKEFGRTEAVGTSDWTTTFSQHTSMIWGIPSTDQARSFSDFLCSRGMLAEVVQPSHVVTDWSVVATSL